MNNYDSEYHAFGPWIIEINQKYPLPPLFVPYYKEADDHLLLIKIPRNIDRKDAKPGMHLYDYVIGLYEDFLYILERKDTMVVAAKLTYDEIAGMNDFNNLLLGELTLYLTDRVIKIRYNTVSHDLITKLITIIRDRYTTKVNTHGQNNFDSINLKKNDILFFNLLNNMQKNNELFNTILFQPTTALKSTHDNILQKAFRIISQDKLLSSIHLINNKELVVVTRGKLIRKRKEAIYSYSLTYMPLDKIQEVLQCDDPHYNNIKQLHLKTYIHSFVFYFDSGNKLIEETYRDFIPKIYTSHAQ